MTINYVNAPGIYEYRYESPALSTMAAFGVLGREVGDVENKGPANPPTPLRSCRS